MTDDAPRWPPEPQTVRLFGRRRGETEWTPIWAYQLKGFSGFHQFEFKAEEVGPARPAEKAEG